MITSGFGAFEFPWPTILLCAMLLGLIVSGHFGSGPRPVAAADQLHRLVTTRPQAAQPEAQQALESLLLTEVTKSSWWRPYHQEVSVPSWQVVRVKCWSRSTPIREP
jgi:hypothetical protein